MVLSDNTIGVLQQLKGRKERRRRRIAGEQERRSSMWRGGEGGGGGEGLGKVEQENV